MHCVIFMGPQGAGKSTFFATRFAQTHLHLSLDVLRTRHREQRLLQVCWETQLAVVVDNTNPTKAERARYVVPARQHRFRVSGYVFEADYADLLARNALRQGRACVPEVAIRATLKKFERPDAAEGFDELFSVRSLGHSGEFVVAPFTPALEP